MKAVLFALFLGLLMVGCGESSQPSGGVDMNDTAPKKDAIETAIDLSKLKDRDGVKYLPNEETPFTGRACWYKNGQKKSESICKNGKVMSAKVWKPNGEKCPVTSLKDGNGLLALWHVNGQKSSEAKFKNGKREGRMIYYNYDGTEMGSIKYMDGERIYDFD